MISSACLHVLPACFCPGGCCMWIGEDEFCVYWCCICSFYLFFHHFSLTKSSDHTGMKSITIKQVKTAKKSSYFWFLFVIFHLALNEKSSVLSSISFSLSLLCLSFSHSPASLITIEGQTQRGHTCCPEHLVRSDSFLFKFILSSDMMKEDS